MSAPRPVPPWLERGLEASLTTWAVGVQVHEGLATAGAVLTTLLSVAGARALRRSPSWATWWPLAGLVAWSLVAPWLAGNTPTGAGVARLGDWLMLPAAAFAASQLTPRGVLRLGVTAGAVLLVACVVAGTQHFGLWPRSEAFASLEWTRLPFWRMDETVPGRDDRFMAGGLLLHRLKFANVSVALVVLLAGLSAFVAPRSRALAVLAVAAAGPVLVWPHARAAAVALVLGLAVTAVRAALSRRAALGVTGIVVLAAGLLLSTMPSARTRFSEGLSTEGRQERLIIVQAGLRAVEQHPWAGVGLGRFRPALYAEGDVPSSVREHQGKAHNQVVSIAAEAGLPAAILALWLVVVLARRGMQTGARGATLVGTLTVLLVLSALHDPLFHPESSMALMLCVGVGLGLTWRDERRTGSGLDVGLDEAPTHGGQR